MAEVRLTQDADYLLCVLYNAYCTRRKNGELSSDAKIFGNGEAIQRDYIPEWPSDDIDEVARELGQAGMVLCHCADNRLLLCCLLPDGISYMQHRFGDKVDQLTQRISALRTAIFG